MSTLCLGHSTNDQPNGCPKANECLRHVALRASNFPHESTIIGCACVQAGFPLFVPTEAATANFIEGIEE